MGREWTGEGSQLREVREDRSGDPVVFLNTDQNPSGATGHSEGKESDTLLRRRTGLRSLHNPSRLLYRKTRT